MFELVSGSSSDNSTRLATLNDPNPWHWFSCLKSTWHMGVLFVDARETHCLISGIPGAEFQCHWHVVMLRCRGGSGACSGGQDVGWARMAAWGETALTIGIYEGLDRDPFAAFFMYEAAEVSAPWPGDLTNPTKRGAAEFDTSISLGRSWRESDR